MSTMFTLAPSGHSKDPVVLEAGYKLWSTFKRDKAVIFVRSNLPETAGGQIWSVIARRVKGTWHVQSGQGHFAQGGRLLARHLISKRSKVRSEVEAHQGSVSRYKATPKVYSLPSILNHYVAVVSRDREADRRSNARKVSLADMLAAHAERKKGGG